jgi:hypothetical protein
LLDVSEDRSGDDSLDSPAIDRQDLYERLRLGLHVRGNADA